MAAPGTLALRTGNAHHRLASLARARLQTSPTLPPSRTVRAGFAPVPLPPSSQSKCETGLLADGPCIMHGLARISCGGSGTGIAELHGEARQRLERRTQRRPQRLHGQHQLEQFFQVMRLRVVDACFFEPRLQVFFRALLAVKAHLIMQRHLAPACQCLCGEKITLGFGAPLTRGRFHTSPSPCG